MKKIEILTHTLMVYLTVLWIH